MSSPSSNDDVTVVVTNYNYGAFLPEAVASALAQEGGPPRVVVVDDGSTDPDTGAVLAGLPPPVAVIRQANQGLSAARNAGLRRATTPLLIVLDADDRLTPCALGVLKSALHADPRLGFAYGITRFFGDWAGVLAMPPYHPYKLLYRHMIGSTALMRREVFEANGGFDPAFKGFEDWEFWLNALSHGWEGRRVDAETFLYRRHGDTMVSGARRGYRGWYRMLRRKHAALYARRSERALARRTGVTLPTRLLHRWFWGWRPIPARVEIAVYALLWRRR